MGNAVNRAYVRPRWSVKLRRSQRRAINIYGTELRLSVFVVESPRPHRSILWAGFSLDKLQGIVAAYVRNCGILADEWPREEGPAVDANGWRQAPGNPWERGDWTITKATVLSLDWVSALFTLMLWTVGIASMMMIIKT